MRHGKLEQSLAKDLQDLGYVSVPRIDFTDSVVEGKEHIEQKVDYLAFKAEWLHNTLSVQYEDLALIRVMGDSMVPTLSDGDMVLVDVSEWNVESDALYVLQLLESLIIKRIQISVTGAVRIRSDNNIYPYETVSRESLHRLNVIGKVVWYGRRP